MLSTPQKQRDLYHLSSEVIMDGYARMLTPKATPDFSGSQFKQVGYGTGSLSDQLKAFNKGAPSVMQKTADFNPNAYGDKMMAQGILGAGKAMQSAMSQSTYTPSAEAKFSPNMWSDIGGGELQNTGMAGSSMNLYIQKMLSNPAIMQLLQQRMSQGVSNGS